MTMGTLVLLRERAAARAAEELRPRAWSGGSGGAGLDVRPGLQSGKACSRPAITMAQGGRHELTRAAKSYLVETGRAPAVAASPSS